MNKRGLSDVIVVVLIVLLSLVAIVLVWTFVRTSIDDTGKEVDRNLIFASTRFSLVPGTVDTSNNNINFTLQRDAGAGDIDGFIIILEDQFGNSSLYGKHNRTAIAELGRIKISILKTEHGLAGNVTKVSVFPTIVGDEGEILTPDNPVVQHTIAAGGSIAASGGNPGSTCGNAIMDAGEQCDDGNLIDGDGCSSICQIDSIVISACGTILDRSGMTYVINPSLSQLTAGAQNDCLTIRQDNIILEGNNKEIIDSIPSYGSGEAGIYIAAGRTLNNITIRNLKIRNFDQAIYLITVDRIQITNVIVNNTLVLPTGFFIDTVSNLNITNSNLCSASPFDFSPIECSGSGSANTGSGNFFDGDLSGTSCSSVQHSPCP